MGGLAKSCVKSEIHTLKIRGHSRWGKSELWVWCG